jgi:hypothetical protein
MGSLRARAPAAAAAVLAIAGLLGGRCALAAPTAQQVEAVFLFYFTEFVAWPPSAFADQHAPIAICVLGDEHFGGALDQAVAGEQVNGRSLVVHRVQSAADAADCQILYISASESARLPQILGALKGHSILTVSDMDGFVEGGGIIRFTLVNARVQLRINAEAARAAGLVLSSKLLRAAGDG